MVFDRMLERVIVTVNDMIRIFLGPSELHGIVMSKNWCMCCDRKAERQMRKS